MDRFRQVLFTSSHLQRLTAARDYLRSDALEEERPPKPDFLITCEKALPPRQMEHPHPRLEFIYAPIHSALSLDAQTLQRNFQKEWKDMKDKSCVKRWKQDELPWLSYKHDLMCKWMDTVIVKITPRQPLPGVAVETTVEVPSAAQTDSADVVSAGADFAETPPAQGPSVQEFLIAAACACGS